MKANKCLLALALFTGLATFGIAGPGPQYWANLGKTQNEPAAAPAKACTNCCGCAGMQKA